MSRPATAIVLSPADRDSLIQYVRAPTTEQRLVTRAHIILAAAQGDATADIAKRLQVRDATVSKWRRRFAAAGVAGLTDAVRPGPRASVRCDQ